MCCAISAAAAGKPETVLFPRVSLFNLGLWIISKSDLLYRYGCSSEQSLEGQDNEAVICMCIYISTSSFSTIIRLNLFLSLQREVQRLQLLISRMNGKDDSVSFSELLSLLSHLKEVRLIVIDQKVILLSLFSH